MKRYPGRRRMSPPVRHASHSVSAFTASAGTEATELTATPPCTHRFSRSLKNEGHLPNVFEFWNTSTSPPPVLEANSTAACKAAPPAAQVSDDVASRSSVKRVSRPSLTRNASGAAGKNGSSISCEHLPHRQQNHRVTARHVVSHST